MWASGPHAHLLTYLSYKAHTLNKLTHLPPSLGLGWLASLGWGPDSRHVEGSGPPHRGLWSAPAHAERPWRSGRLGRGSVGRFCAKKQRAVPLRMTPTPLGGLVAGGALQKNTFAVPHALSKRTVHRGGCSPWCVRFVELEIRHLSAEPHQPHIRVSSCSLQGNRHPPPRPASPTPSLPPRTTLDHPTRLAARVLPCSRAPAQTTRRRTSASASSCVSLCGDHGKCFVREWPRVASGVKGYRSPAADGLT